jgi:preprotein translocase subunit SecY
LIILFRTLGFLLVLGGLLWMVIAELVLHKGGGSLVQLMFLGGVLMLAVSLVLSIMGRVSAKVAGKRCRRCNKPVQHGHLYCSDHLKEMVNEVRDHQRRKGEGG